MGGADGLRSAARVDLVWSPAPRRIQHIAVSLEAPITPRRALQASGWLQLHSPHELLNLQPGCWGRRVGWDDELPDGARIELYRPLQVDPKEARRKRYRSHAPAGRFRRRPLEG